MVNLEKDDVYTTNNIVPLMPELDPEWALVAINKIKYLPTKTEFQVILSAKKREIDWYFVKILNTIYQGDTGWINSLAIVKDIIKDEKKED